MSIMLAIETSNPSSATGGGGAGVARDGTSALRGPGIALGRRTSGGLDVFAVHEIDPARPHDDQIMPLIDRAFREHGLRPRDLGSVGVSIGPGGFTSVRIAIVTAKMLAEATGARCLGVPTAMVAARARVRRVGGEAEPSGNFAVALASKRETAWLSVFGPDGTVIEAGVLADAAKVKDVFDRHSVRELLADRFLPESMARTATTGGAIVAPIQLDPVSCLHAMSGDVLAVEPLELLPMYPREAEAVTKWRELHPPPDTSSASAPPGR
ncbi:MAG: tRNA (adenosine(37)-N6)-threonylcarbamoyltransferase complex dimerization subunit type 1 TsaB [Phycisphaerales bacterium]|nr:MAG: tRNA (adenosine(37)-N6)-threonylcarbamoyltransferase complex dimerization subunit type 1 TsaB [Phycisphaerales bacterium]